jgi:hypothetical protein
VPRRSATVKSVPRHIVAQVEQRLKHHANQRAPQFRSVVVRARGRYLYVDAQGPDDGQAEPLCRLGYLGSVDDWEFAFFSWSRGASGGYEPSVLDSGLYSGKPEDCFDCGAFPYQWEEGN